MPDDLSEREKQMDTLYIVIPAYNEQENIGRTIEEWYPVAEEAGGDSKIVIIDDGSRDNTFDIIKEYAASRPRLVPLTKPNGGHGATVLYGYNYALEHGADFIFQTDSDGQTLPGEFKAFWEKRGEYDMVIGRRDGRQDGFSRVLVTKTLKAVVRATFGVNVPDANTPFRLMKAETLGKYIGLIPEGFNLSNVILSVIFVKKGCKVKFIPITFRPRQGGVNSINLKKIFKIGKKALTDFKEINESLKQ